MNTPANSSPSSSAALDTARSQLWAATATTDEDAAVRAAFAALDAGAEMEAVLLDAIAPVQMRVGIEWAANRISVTDEHAATAINERVVAALARRLGGRRRSADGRMTVACVAGEWHALPGRLLAEVLALRGWQVDFLGAHVPTPHLLGHLRRTGADAVALSSSLALRLPAAHTTINACRTAGFPVLVGGAAFGTDGRYAHLLGAGVWACDARSAADQVGEELVRPEPSAVRPAVDDLPHLDDQEYTMVTQSATQLVKETLGTLEERVPGLSDYTERQQQYHTEDIAYIVDHLATALYVDDDAVFSTFLTWTADILTAREVPPHCLHTALEILTGQLKDFPRALHMLNQAQQALTTHLDGTPPGPEKPT